MRRLVTVSCLLAASVIALTACSPDTSNTDKTPAATSAGTQTVPTAADGGSPSPTALISISTPRKIDAPFGLDPISEPAVATTNVPLKLAEAGTPNVDPSTPGYDRMSFQFGGDRPAYEIKYVPGPVQDCASGEDAHVNGQAFLQIRFSPAVAHDEQGAQTVSPTDLQPNLPVISQAKQTCDFEGVVVWTLGLSEEVDFRAFTLLDILVVDLKHP